MINDSQSKKRVVSPLEVRLTEIETGLSMKIDNLIEKFDAVSNGTGFPRCSDRGARIATLEREASEFRAALAKEVSDETTRRHDDASRREFDRLERSFVWLRNLIVLGLLAGIFIKLWFTVGAA